MSDNNSSSQDQSTGTSREERDQLARDLFGLTDNTMTTEAAARDLLGDPGDVTRIKQTYTPTGY